MVYLDLLSLYFPKELTAQITKRFDVTNESQRVGDRLLIRQVVNGIYHGLGKICSTDGETIGTCNYVDGVLHSPDGPAIQYFDGEETYYWKGEKLNQKKFWKKAGITEEVQIKSGTRAAALLLANI